MFDLYLHAEANEITLQRIDAASLLWRLQLLGADVGERWQRLLAGWALDETVAAGGSAFNDVHALLALLGAGERDARGALDERRARQRRARRPVEPRRRARGGGAADARAVRLRRRPLRRRRAACSGRSAAPAAPASAAAMPSAT